MALGLNDGYREDVVREFEQHGFRLAHEHTFLPLQHFLAFEPVTFKADR